jgi:hypothetical protein
MLGVSRGLAAAPRSPAPAPCGSIAAARRPRIAPARGMKVRAPARRWRRPPPGAAGRPPHGAARRPRGRAPPPPPTPPHPQENIAPLAPIDGVAAVVVTLPDGTEWRVPNAPGKAASARIYAHLAAGGGGALGPAQAAEGLRLYGEYVEEARAQPGSHPNIDLLFRIADGLECTASVERAQ